MDVSALLTDSKWNIVKELTKGALSPTDLAKKTRTSIANISQQLKLLEAYGLVKKERILNSENQVGKPKINYSLHKEIIELTFIKKGLAVKKNVESNFLTKAIFMACAQLSLENCFILMKFLLKNDEILEHCQAIGIIKANPELVELLLITNNLQDIREKYSNQELKKLDGKEKKIVCWTHSMEELESGLKAKERHFIDITTNIKEFMDKENYIERIEAIKNGEV